MRSLQSPAFISFQHFSLLFTILVFLGFSTTSVVAESRTINVVLFGYIPDANHDNFAALTSQLEDRFKASNPGITLNITLDPNIDVYDQSTLSKLLGKSSDSVQLVEIDTVMLGGLVKEKLVQPINYQPAGIVPLAMEASKVNNILYAVPTYLCSNVVYSGSDQLKKAVDSYTLVQILEDYQPGKIPLIGNYKGSWTLSGFYTDAWADTNSNNPAGLPASLRLPLQPATVKSLSAAVDSCYANGKNPCLDGTYKDNNLAVEAFARGEANGFVGYTESLFAILSARAMNAPALNVVSAPMGRGENPVMYVDGLVFNSNCTGQCLVDAQVVAKYLTATATRNFIAFSQDAGANAIPRYLLQADELFYNDPNGPGANNVYYKALWSQIVVLATPVPNIGVPESKSDISKALQIALEFR